MQPPPPVSPHVAASFARQGLMRSLGARLVEAKDGRCTIEAPFGDALGQQHGLFHGGAIAAIADTAGGFAALSAARGGDVLTAEFKISFLRPAAGKLVRARAEVLRLGRGLATVACRVHVVAADGEVHCAELLGTMAIRGADDRPGRDAPGGAGGPAA
ncbi:MAG TPA: PaaI family thioesterase [Allosphingosinicella sp.]|nr:PaaI family thioesterase [Allosphingosinicella sp.]